MATWNFDAAHTAVTFSARHMMVTTVHGRFAPPKGRLELDPQHPERAHVEAEIDATSVSTGVADRDKHLRSADFLDAEHFPTISFQSTKVELTGGDQARVTGWLTIRGVKRPVTLDVEYLGEVDTPFGDKRAGFTASTRINREDWGLTWNMAIEAGGVLVGKDIRIALDVEAILVPEAEPAVASV